MTAYAELGSALRSAREKAGRSISEISTDTGLPERYVRALERGQMDELPDLSYARLYLQSYARALKLDSEKMLESWPGSGFSLPVERPGVTRTQAAQAPRSSPVSAIWMMTGALIVVALVGAYFVLKDNPAPGSDSALAQAAPAATAPTTSPVTSAQQSIETQATEAGTESAPEKTTVQSAGASTAVPLSPFGDVEAAPVPARKLDVQVTGQTWLVIEADGDTLMAKVVTQGEQVSVESHSDFLITAANPRVIQLQIDGEPLPLSVRLDRPLIRYLIPRKDAP